MFYIFKDCYLTISLRAKEGLTLTDEIKDVFDDIKSEKQQGSWVFQCEDLSALKAGLDSGFFGFGAGLFDAEYETEISYLSKTIEVFLYEKDELH